jgi:type II secretory pathway pseudopilin PulG
MTSTALEEAQYGNQEAITAIINRSLQKKGITASVDLDHGDLHVMLDAKQAPPEAAAEFIFKGVQKLDVESAYDLHVYGRKVGELFATWCYDYELQVRPFALVNLSARQQAQNSSSGGLQIRLSGADGEDINLDIVQALGFLGIVITILGVFSPVITAPIVGTLNYLRNGAEEAIILMVLTAFSALFLARKHYSWLYGSSVWAFLLVGGTFFYYQSFISDIKASTDRELAGNPFRGLADMAMAATGLSWGWVLLFLGTGLVVAAAYLRKRQLDKQAFFALMSPVLAVAAIVLLSFPYYAITSPGLANKARASEAKTYIGSINRSQQAFRLENSKFAEDFATLDIGIPSDSEYYQYEIAIADDDMAVATATAKTRGISSLAGAVFILGSDTDFPTTQAILCESNKSSKTAPDLPTVSEDDNPQCAPGSSEP